MYPYIATLKSSQSVVETLSGHFNESNVKANCILMRKATELVLLQGDQLLSQHQKVNRFPMYHLLANNQIMAFVKVPQADSVDLLFVLTSDLVFNLCQLVTSDSSLQEQGQIKVVSYLDPKEELPISELPKLYKSRVTFSTYFTSINAIFILFENLSYLIIELVKKTESEEGPVSSGDLKISTFTLAELSQFSGFDVVQVQGTSTGQVTVLYHDQEDKQFLATLSLKKGTYDSLTLEEVYTLEVGVKDVDVPYVYLIETVKDRVVVFTDDLIMRVLREDGRKLLKKADLVADEFIVENCVKLSEKRHLLLSDQGRVKVILDDDLYNLVTNLVTCEGRIEGKLDQVTVIDEEHVLCQMNETSSLVYKVEVDAESRGKVSLVGTEVLKITQINDMKIENHQQILLQKNTAPVGSTLTFQTDQIRLQILESQPVETGFYLNQAWSTCSGDLLISGDGVTQALTLTERSEAAQRALKLKEVANLTTDAETIEYLSLSADLSLQVTTKEINLIGKNSSEKSLFESPVFLACSYQVSSTDAFALVVHDDRTLDLYHASYKEAEHKTVLEKRNTAKFETEIHSITFVSADFFAVNFWNQSLMHVFRTESPKDELLKFDISDYAPFQALEVDLAKVVKLRDPRSGEILTYLLAGLSNGYLFCFNLYEKLLHPDSLAQLGDDAAKSVVRLCNTVKAGNIIQNFAQFGDNFEACSVISDEATFLLTVDGDRNLKDLRIKKLGEGIEVIQKLGEYSFVQQASKKEGGQRLFQIATLVGPSLSSIHRYGQSQTIHLKGHTVQKFEYIDSLNLIIAACFSEPGAEVQEVSCLLVIDRQTGKTLQQITYKSNEYPSALATHFVAGLSSFEESKLMVYVGVSSMRSTDEVDKQEFYSPQSGSIYTYAFDVELQQVNCSDQNGAIYDLKVFQTVKNPYLTEKSQIQESKSTYLVAGINVHVSIFEIQPSDRVPTTQVAQIDTQILVYKVKVVVDPIIAEVTIMVADIMKSLSVYKFDPELPTNRLQVTARFPNGQWCLEMLQITGKPSSSLQPYYATTDLDNNLNILTKKNEGLLSHLIQFDAASNLGEQVNAIRQSQTHKVKERELMQVDHSSPSDVFISPSYLQTQKLPHHQSFFEQGQKIENLLESQDTLGYHLGRPLILATSEGSLLSVYFVTEQIHKVLELLQNQLRDNLKNAGKCGSHKAFKQPKIKGEVDFDTITEVIDGDFVEKFLELPYSEQSSVADQALHQSGASLDLFQNVTSEQLTLKEVRLVVSLVKQLVQQH